MDMKQPDPMCPDCKGSGGVQTGENEYSTCPCVSGKIDAIKHLNWIYDRMIYQLGQDPKMDYMIKFKSIIDQL